MANKDDIPRIAFNPDRFDLLETKDIKLYFLWDNEKQKQVMVFDGDLVVTGKSYATEIHGLDEVSTGGGPLQHNTGIVNL